MPNEQTLSNNYSVQKAKDVAAEMVERILGDTQQPESIVAHLTRALTKLVLSMPSSNVWDSLCYRAAPLSESYDIEAYTIASFHYVMTPSDSTEVTVNEDDWFFTIMYLKTSDVETYVQRMTENKATTRPITWAAMAELLNAYTNRCQLEDDKYPLDLRFLYYGVMAFHHFPDVTFEEWIRLDTVDPQDKSMAMVAHLPDGVSAILYHDGSVFDRLVTADTDVFNNVTHRYH